MPRKPAKAVTGDSGPPTPPAKRDRRHDNPGRPSKYKPEFTAIAVGMYRAGATDALVAVEFGVSTSLLSQWRRKDPEFERVCLEAKAQADDNVQQSLYRQAVGYERDVERVTVVPSGEVVKYTVREWHKPSERATLHWLACRDAAWPLTPRDARPAIDLGAALTGPDGLARAFASLLDALGRGDITVDQARGMSAVIDAAGSSIERNQIAKDVEALQIEDQSK